MQYKNIDILPQWKSPSSTLSTTPTRPSLLRTIYWDVDDVALNTSETCVNLINTLYNIPNNLPLKTIYDIKDWSFKSINRNLTSDQLISLFSSPEFWSSIRVRPEFTSIFTPSILHSYAHFFVTKGSPSNLTNKNSFLQSHFPYYDYTEFIGIPLDQSKNTVDMSDGILIDDNLQNLIDSNAGLKVLLTNNLHTNYNNTFGEYARYDISSIYILNTLDEVKQLLEFNLKHDLSYNH